MRVLPYLAVLCVITSHAEARGGGGFGGFGVGLRSGSPMRVAPAVHLNNGLRHVHNPRVDHLAGNRPVQRVGRLNHQQTASLGWWGGWPYAWWPDYAQASYPPPQQLPTPPQIIVINADAQGHMTTKTQEVDPQPYNVAGCQPIPNGYHCDQQ